MSRKSARSKLYELSRRGVNILRSLLIYYFIPFRVRSLSRFYSQFIQPGSLCFDIGAHLGNRTKALRRLDARVIAVEPQPACIRILTRFYGGDPGIEIVPMAVGASPGLAVMYLSKSTPTVSSLAHDWIRTMKDTSGFKKVRWDAEIQVNVTTLDALINQFGLPAYTKIDVEGFEFEVLRGLHRPLPLISFEYIPAASQRAQACISRLNELGIYQFNWTVRERTHFVSSTWIDAKQMEKIISGFPGNHPSGDIYCRLIDNS